MIFFDRKYEIGYESYKGEYCDYEIFDYGCAIKEVSERIRELLDKKDFESIAEEVYSFAKIEKDYKNTPGYKMIVYKDDYSNYEVINRYVMEYKCDDKSTMKIGILLGDIKGDF